ncbi:hypothetical protein CENSYa_0174 [Cenarchaeum symbiosum A]|uniref:Uncharacterized protein n=1 Tax=Cenarchaeum symbiosum (strain A) TaxID=414004 RepID=A0RU02_CENSY|nr:hypothetical protein CENSYa_0174 [Cenarchaeum symbiosum A]
MLSLPSLVNLRVFQAIHACREHALVPTPDAVGPSGAQTCFFQSPDSCSGALPDMPVLDRRPIHLPMVCGTSPRAMVLCKKTL